MSLKKSFLSLALAAVLVASAATVSVSALEARPVRLPVSRSSSYEDDAIPVPVYFPGSPAAASMSETPSAIRFERPASAAEDVKSAARIQFEKPASCLSAIK